MALKLAQNIEKSKLHWSQIRVSTNSSKRKTPQKWGLDSN
jgi:hypothetical protein